MHAGIILRPYVKGDLENSTLTIYTFDPETGKASTDEVVWTGLLGELPANIQTEHSAIKLVLNSKTNRPFNFHSSFATQNIDQSTRFCEGNKILSITESNSPQCLSDGSGEEDYPIKSDCQWTLKPQLGHDLVIEFLELDTELKVDSIYLFSGEQTTQTDLLLQLSGIKLPPKMILRGDAALLWLPVTRAIKLGGFTVELSITPYISVPNEEITTYDAVINLKD